MGEGVEIVQGDCLTEISKLPDEYAQLVVTSPPYNIGKDYETNRDLKDYVAWQTAVIRECFRVLSWGGSLCWQVGTYVRDGDVMPLDMLLWPAFDIDGLHLRNRIVWVFDHGLHASQRFSGRYETVLWFSKGRDYYFNLDAVRVPQKWQNKRYFKGDKKGELSCNPLGKNPGDVWVISNVKHNHPEKTAHPCQFPEELIERLILSLTQPGEMVLDPFAGSGTSLSVAARLHRRALGIELREDYCEIARRRLGRTQVGLPLEVA